MNTQAAITILKNLSTWGRLSADQRQAILAGLAALRETEWLPIETAPKDGSSVLLWVKYADVPVVGSFHKYHVSRQGAWYFDTENYEVAGDGSVCNEAGSTPTHWRPIPTPPANAPETEKTT